MKLQTRTLLLALCMAFAGTAFATGKHDHGHSHVLKPLHGGVVAEAKDVEYELVAKPDGIRLHVRDHGKPVDVSKATAKVTLLAGADKQEAELKPAGDKLEASGSFRIAAGTKVVAQFTTAGKSQTVRFVLK